MFYVQSTITVISGRRRKNEKKKERKKERKKKRKEKKGEASSLWGILLSSCQLSPHCPQRLALKTRRPSAFARVWTLTEVDFKGLLGGGGKFHSIYDLTMEPTIDLTIHAGNVAKLALTIHFQLKVCLLFLNLCMKSQYPGQTTKNARAHALTDTKS